MALSGGNAAPVASRGGDGADEAPHAIQPSISVRLLQNVPTREFGRNRLLALLPDDEYGRLEGHLTRVRRSVGDVFIQADEPIEVLVFPESGLVSLVLATRPETEVGVIGFEGVAGVSAILGIDSSPVKAVCQIAGSSALLPASLVRRDLQPFPVLRRLLQLYAHTLNIQAATTVFANAHFTVEQRLARWLLLAHDRVEGDDIGLTHEFLAIMLCVRRPGVTVATHVLEGNGFIRARRGRITILDRDGLKKLAGESYGIAEREYETLLLAAAETGIRQAG